MYPKLYLLSLRICDYVPYGDTTFRIVTGNMDKPDSNGGESCYPPLIENKDLV